MTAAQYRRRRGMSPVLIFVLLFVVIIGTVATLYATGEISLSFLTAQPTDNEPNQIDTRGMVLVPVSAVLVEPYEKISLNHLLDRTTGSPKSVRMPANSIGDRVIVDISQIVGRVVKVQVPPGYPFHEGLFLPKGTRSGVTGGIPPGKRGMTVQADQVQGFFGLKAGDRFDLAAAAPIEASPEDLGDGLQVEGSLKKHLELEARMNNLDKQANVRMIVQNGMVVTPVRGREEEYTAHSAIGGSRNKKKEVQELMIAVDPGEVALLMEAIAVGMTITCIPRSGHADDPVDSITPGLEADIPFSLDANGAPKSGKGRRRSSGAETDGAAEGGARGLLDTLRRVEVIEGKGGTQKKDVHLVPDRGNK